MSKILVKIPLTKYLREITKEWPSPFLTKTFGGQVWISDEDPGTCFNDGDPNEMEFDKSMAYFQLPKEIHQPVRQGGRGAD